MDPSLMARDHLGPKPPRTNEALELDIATLTYECVEKAREACKAADALGNGRVRLLVQGLLDSAIDANHAVLGEDWS